MALYLVQHGKSQPAEIDPERGLTEEGIREVERIAATAKEYGVPVSLVQHSGKKRAEQTALIFASVLNPGQGVEGRDGLNPMDDVVPIARQVNAADNVMIVGHLPFMERLSSYLITGSPDRPVFKFQNAGIVCLDHEPYVDTWVIRWALMPHIE